MTVKIEGGPGGSLNRDVTSIDSSSTTTHTTSGEDIILVDTSSAAVTITLSTTDATADPESRVDIIDSGDNAATNNINIDTEGSETIDPGSESSKTIDVDGASLSLQGNGTNWFRIFDGAIPVNTGTVTLSGGSTPALDTVIADVLAVQTHGYAFTLYVDSDPAFNADYAFNYDYSHVWDDSDSAIDIDLTANWDTDPGGGNDVTARWEVFA